VEIRRNLRASRVLDRELRNLHESTLDGVDQTEVGHDPREGAPRLRAATVEVERRRREIHAHVHTADTMDAVEPFDPDRRLAAIDLSEPVLVFRLDRAGVAAPVSLVLLVDQDQDGALASDVLAENIV